MIKTGLISFIFLLSINKAYSQQLSHVSFSSGSSLSHFAFTTDQGVLIRISIEGNIIEWGTEIRATRGNYYAPNLQPYMGKTEYYGAEADSIFRGKLKSIGTCYITYYGSYEQDEKPGKIKTIGNAFFDYYSRFEDKDLRGKIKMAGNQPFSFYSAFADEAYRGKLKSIGNTTIVYYSSFDDRLIRGKIKNIGPLTYSWYGSYDQSDYRGSLKSGAQRQNLGSVTYIIW